MVYNTKKTITQQRSSTYLPNKMLVPFARYVHYFLNNLLYKLVQRGKNGYGVMLPNTAKQFIVT
jgi:hypothetical protein